MRHPHPRPKAGSARATAGARRGRPPRGATPDAHRHREGGKRSPGGGAASRRQSCVQEKEATSVPDPSDPSPSCSHQDLKEGEVRRWREGVVRRGSGCPSPTKLGLGRLGTVRAVGAMSAHARFVEGGRPGSCSSARRRRQVEPWIPGRLLPPSGLHLRNLNLHQGLARGHKNHNRIKAKFGA